MIEINGIKYTERKPIRSKQLRRSLGIVSMYAIIADAMIYDDCSTKEHLKESDPLYGINIIEEYELIQKKKSTLSARKRAMVVHTFERKFIKVKTK